MGTYYIYEISTGTAASLGYKFDDQRTIYPNNSDPNKFAGTQNHGNAIYLGDLKLDGDSAEIKGIKQVRQKRKNNYNESR